jgi:hypothetical protein
MEPTRLETGSFIRREAKTDRHTHTGRLPVSGHVMPCTTLGLCQQEGHH